LGLLNIFFPIKVILAVELTSKHSPTNSIPTVPPPTTAIDLALLILLDTSFVNLINSFVLLFLVLLIVQPVDNIK